MQSQRKYKTFLLLFTLVLSACAGNAPTEDPGLVMTSAVGTMVAGFFETQTAMVTPSTLTPTATETKFPTPTSFVTQTPLVSPTSTFSFFTATLGTPRTPTVTGTLPTATVNSSALAFGCSNLAFVRDVNYPNGTVVKPSQNFTKTWKVENTGSCDWLYSYRLIFVGGTDFDPATGTLGKLVHSGDWAELSVNLDAPKKPGTYTASWRFSDGTNMFGATLSVTIKVEQPVSNTAVPTNTTVPNTSTSTQTSVPTIVPSETPTITLTP
jgi:hypothetical protein